jgi:hypothetical protein|tara:strand:+ start:127 stop:396 length:270 start_codon:yes stop_codon:yes gene_type:complete
MTQSVEWHLSKSIPLTFVLAIIGQTIALVWFVSSLNSEIQTNAREIVRHETRIIALEQMVQAQSVTMARIDENIKSIRMMMEDIRNRGR